MQKDHTKQKKLLYLFLLIWQGLGNTGVHIERVTVTPLLKPVRIQPRQDSPEVLYEQYPLISQVRSFVTS